MVRDALRGYVAAASGFTEDLLSSGRRNRESLVLLVRHEVEQAVKRRGLAPSPDVDGLTRRVRELERQVRELKAGTTRKQDEA
jgi:polyhydroxyalkanoate synthesis regulator phasin